MSKLAEGQPRVQWQSVKWPDSSTYEGLVKHDKCHVRGVFKYSNGDRYEGEFEENSMSGFGVYVWGAEGSVYRGQWRNSMMDGCGVKITKQPNGGFLAEEGEFVNDEWVGNAVACTVEQARVAAAEADTAAQMARVFELGGTSGDGAAAVARAQAAVEAATAAVAAAAPAKSRRHQRHQQQQQQQQQAAVPAPLLSAAVGVEAPAAGAAQPVPSGAVPARQRQQGAAGIAQDVAAGVQQAASGVQKAAQQALQRLTAGVQMRMQKRQEPPTAAA